MMLAGCFSNFRYGCISSAGYHTRNIRSFQPADHIAIRFGSNKKQWLRPPGFRTAFEFYQELLRTSPAFVGEIPEGFSVQDTDVNRLIQDIDALSSALRQLNMDIPPVSVDLGGKSYHCEYIAEGGYGRVFKLSRNGKSYAFKNFYDCYLSLSGGVYAETEIARWLKENKVRDVAEFYFGRPQQGWMISKFIDEDTAMNRNKGPSFSDMMERYPALVNNDDVPKNRKNGFRVDYGGIYASYESLPIKTLEQFKAYLKNPETRIAAAFQLNFLPEASLPEAVGALMDYPECQPVFLTPWMYDNRASLTPGMAKTLFDKILHHPKAITLSSLHGIWLIYYMSPADRQKALVEVCNNPITAQRGFLVLQVLSEEHKFISPSERASILKEITLNPGNAKYFIPQIPLMSSGDQLRFFERGFSNPTNSVISISILPFLDGSIQAQALQILEKRLSSEAGVLGEPQADKELLKKIAAYPKETKSRAELLEILKRVAMQSYFVQKYPELSAGFIDPA